LVENPAEVTAVVNAYLDAPNGIVASPTSALVTGYDFLTDTAEAVRDELVAGLGRPIDSSLRPPTRRPKRVGRRPCGDALLTSRHDLVFLAGHFNAFGAGRGLHHASHPGVRGGAADFKNSILVSAGCHSGYNAVDRDGIPLVTPEVDWAQACARRQATLVAGTGYQYGDTDFIEYSERLYLEFFRQLRRVRPGVRRPGALRSKRQYLATTPVLRGLHESVRQTALFGLPMLKVNRRAGGSPAAGYRRPGRGQRHTYATPPGSVLGLAYADLQVTPTFSPPGPSCSMTSKTRPGHGHLLGRPGRDHQQPRRTHPPLEVRNVTLDGTVLRGVGFRGAQYQDQSDLIPLTGAATTEIRVHVGFPSSLLPAPAVGRELLRSLCSTDGGATRLTLATAQFRDDSPASVAGTFRRFDALQFRLFYNNNLTTYPEGGLSTPGRSGPPSIAGVSASSTGNQVSFEVHVTGNPSAGVQRCG
jgi:hypothetical protein